MLILKANIFQAIDEIATLFLGSSASSWLLFTVVTPVVSLLTALKYHWLKLAHNVSSRF